ncbi:MAG: four helix bundle protein [Melioribacteraceae bacterium]|nr:four helix bundle protein [Melioribacteraceae bacterium]
MKENNLIKDKAFAFSLMIIGLYQNLVKANEFILSKQLLRSGTSIGANVEEATAAQTKRDFITKMSIASKEARETKYWLRLLNESKLSGEILSIHLKEIDDIINIITAIVKRLKQIYIINS